MEIRRSALAGWAGKLGLECDASIGLVEFRGRVERALAVKYAEASIMTCRSCGFPAPDVDAIDECPGCGVDLGVPARRDMRQAKEENGAAEKITPIRPVRKATSPKSKPSEATARPRKASSDGSAARKPEMDAMEDKQRAKLVELEARIEEKKAALTQSTWDLGETLSEIQATDLWAAFNPTCKSFGEYVEMRFQIATRTASEYIRIHRTFKRAETTTLPKTHLEMIARVEDDKDRQKLLEEVRRKGDDMGKRELAERVKEILHKDAPARAEGPARVSITALREGWEVEGEWAEYRGNPAGEFELGGRIFRVTQIGKKGFKVVLTKKVPSDDAE